MGAWDFFGLSKGVKDFKMDPKDQKSSLNLEIILTKHPSTVPSEVRFAEVDTLQTSAGSEKLESRLR